MPKPSSRSVAPWMRLAVFVLVWGFCLPGAAVLVEIARQGRIRTIPLPIEAVTIAVAAAVVTVCMLSASILARSLGWAVACLGQAALVNAFVPDRPAELQLIWLGTGTTLGVLIGLLAGPPRQRALNESKPVASGSPDVKPTVNSSFWTRPWGSRRASVAGVLVAGAVVACAVQYEIRVATQARIAEAVARSAGSTIYDTAGTPPLLFKWLDRDWGGSGRLCLRSVELGANAGDDELAELSAMGLGRLPHLRELRLRSSQVTDEGLVTVIPLVHLERLTLSHATTDAGLSQLAELSALRTLDLTKTQITGNGLRCVANLPVLTCLCLQSTRVTDDDLAQLKVCSNLATLDLSATSISDAGLVHLKELTNLSSLLLLRTPITDAGLVHLAKVPQLRWVFVSGSKVTRAGLNEFHRLRPSVWTD